MDPIVAAEYSSFRRVFSDKVVPIGEEEEEKRKEEQRQETSIVTDVFQQARKKSTSIIALTNSDSDSYYALVPSTKNVIVDQHETVVIHFLGIEGREKLKWLSRKGFFLFCMIGQNVGLVTSYLVAFDILPRAWSLLSLCSVPIFFLGLITANYSKIKLISANFDALYLVLCTIVWAVGSSLMYKDIRSLIPICGIFSFWGLFKIDAHHLSQRTGQFVVVSVLIAQVLFLFALILLLLDLVPDYEPIVFVIAKEEFSTVRMVLDSTIMLIVFHFNILLNEIRFKGRNFILIDSPVTIERYQGLEHWDLTQRANSAMMLKSLYSKTTTELAKCSSDKSFKKRPLGSIIVPSKPGVHLEADRFLVILPTLPEEFQDTSDTWGKRWNWPVIKTRWWLNLLWIMTMFSFFPLITGNLPKACSLLAIPGSLPIILMLSSLNVNITKLLLASFEIRLLLAVLSLAIAGFIFACNFDIRILLVFPLTLNFISLLLRDAAWHKRFKFDTKNLSNKKQVTPTIWRNTDFWVFLANILWVCFMIVGFYFRLYSDDFLVIRFKFGPIFSSTLQKSIETPMTTMLPFLIRNAYRQLFHPTRLVSLRSPMIEINFKTVNELHAICMGHTSTNRRSLREETNLAKSPSK